MSFGFGFGLPSWQTLSGGFNPSSLFVGGVQGTWYDPSDSTTLFSDTAGTTPSPTPGAGALSVVGLMLDKSQNGVGTNGAYRYNLLTFTEQFDNAAWTLVGGAITANTTIAPNGTTTADTFTASATTARHSILPTTNPAITSGATYTITCYIKKGNYNFITLIFGAAGTTWITATFDFTSGTPVVSKTGAGAVGSVNTSSSASLDQNGFYRLSLTGALTGFSSAFVSVALSSSATPTYGTFGEESWTAAGTETVILWGAQLALATAPTAYQRITADWYSTMAGNHAISYNTTTARPELSARVNLLTYSEQFDNAAWTKGNVTVTANQTTAPDGTTTADLVTLSAGNLFKYLKQSLAALAVSKLVTCYIKIASGTQYFQILADTDATVYANFDVVGNVAGSKGAGVSSSSIQDKGNGWYLISATISSTTASNTYVAVVDSASAGYGANTTSTGTFYIWGADLRPANIGTGVPSYQRIADQYTYDSSGFPRYLVFNGTASGMYTPANLNLSGTDKATVFAGIRKTTTTTGVVAETSALASSNNGAFLGLGTDSGGIEFFAGSRGTAYIDVFGDSASYTSPFSAVTTAAFNIAAPSAQLRVNAVVTETDVGSQGTGNYGSYPLNIGARNASSGTPSFFFPGFLYSLIVVGAASTAAQISSTESWINVKEGGVY